MRGAVLVLCAALSACGPRAPMVDIEPHRPLLQRFERWALRTLEHASPRHEGIAAVEEQLFAPLRAERGVAAHIERSGRDPVDLRSPRDVVVPEGAFHPQQTPSGPVEVAIDRQRIWLRVERTSATGAQVRITLGIPVSR